MSVNAKFLGRSRPRLVDGDIFRIVMPGEVEVLGLVAVARIEITTGKFRAYSGASLFYFYEPGVAPGEFAIDSVRGFLIPPMISNRRGFTSLGVWQKCGTLGSSYNYGGWDRFYVPKSHNVIDLWGRPMTDQDSLTRLREVEKVAPHGHTATTVWHVFREPDAIDATISAALGIPKAMHTTH